jgi:hypothetical protein
MMGLNTGIVLASRSTISSSRRNPDILSSWLSAASLAPGCKSAIVASIR